MPPCGMVIGAITRLLVIALLILTCGSLAAASVAVLAEAGKDLVGHWDLGSGNGKTVRDLSSRGNDGAVTSGKIVSEQAGNSLAFDGMDTRVAIAEQAPFGFADQFTAAIWVRPAVFGRHALIFGRPHANRGWTTPMFGMVQRPGGRISFATWNRRGTKAFVVLGDRLPPNVWVHLAVTYDGQKLTAFVDGITTRTQAHSGAIGHNERPLFLGDAPGRTANPFEGRIGELRLWKCALAATQVRALFDATKGRYDRMAPPLLSRRDGTVAVAAGRDWQVYPTRVLDKLDGYRAQAEPIHLNAYGGWLDRPREDATGFFQAKQINGRWWLIDPDGYRFLHIALNHIRPEYTAAREALVAQYGSKKEWAEATARIFFENGFNGSGCASERTVSRTVSRPLSYTRDMSFMSAFAKSKKLTYATSGHTGFTNGCIPVFHPDFEPFCEKYAGRLGGTKTDPHLLGIFSDNELQAPTDLLERHLALDPTNPDLKPGHDAAVAWLTARRGTASPVGIGRRDRLAFIAFAFERYYRLVHEAIRRHDPNHLYLGSRICNRTQFDNPLFMRMTAKYVDVISVNYYGVWGPDLDQMARWHANSGRPVLITEWYAKAQDTGLANVKGAGWLVRTQQDRAAFYQHYVLGLLESRTCVGWHWFKYHDDPRESMHLDSAGGVNKGMFTVELKPHRLLLDAARAVNQDAYPLAEFFDARK